MNIYLAFIEIVVLISYLFYLTSGSFAKYFMHILYIENDHTHFFFQTAHLVYKSLLPTYIHNQGHLIG